MLIRSPITTTPRRQPGSVRRTSHIDMIPRGESSQAGLGLRGSARDTLTGTDGRGSVLGQAIVHAELGEGRVLRDLATDPHDEATAMLLGRAVAGGFRAAVDAAVPGHRDEYTRLYLLLHELPVAVLIAGYADLYLRTPGESPPQSEKAARMVKSNVCAGWAADGTMMQAIANQGQIPIPIGPPAPALERADDPLAWHAIGPLEAGAMRRRRRIDLITGDPLRIDAMFRDTHVGPDGVETVLHEYSLTAAVDRKRREILECIAQARVLPWPECPAAATSAGRLVGQTLDGLKRFVRQELLGTATCTHLNDLLHSLANIAPMADCLESISGVQSTIDNR